jgi:hypothetical protein
MGEVFRNTTYGTKKTLRQTLRERPRAENQKMFSIHYSMTMSCP